MAKVSAKALIDVSTKLVSLANEVESDKRRTHNKPWTKKQEQTLRRCISDLQGLLRSGLTGGCACQKGGNAYADTTQMRDESLSIGSGFYSTVSPYDERHLGGLDHHLNQTNPFSSGPNMSLSSTDGLGGGIAQNVYAGGGKPKPKPKPKRKQT